LKLFKQVVQGAEIRGILQLSCSTIALVRFAQTATKNVSYILAMQVLQSFDTCSEDGSESYQKQWNNHKIVLIARVKSDAEGGAVSLFLPCLKVLLPSNHKGLSCRLPADGRIHFVAISFMTNRCMQL